MDPIRINNNGQMEEYILGKYANKADCSIMQRVGDSMILCTLCIDRHNIVSGNFVPLSVQYSEKMYAVGRIPQGFIKREGKPSDSEILASRLIDRSIRPLFPKHFPYAVQMTLLVLSYDGKSDIYKDCINLASICLFISEIPLLSKRILNATRVIRIANRFEILNAINTRDSSLDLLVSGIDSNVSMIEMQSNKTIIKGREYTNEVSHRSLMNAMFIATERIAENTKSYTTAFLPFVKPKLYIDDNDSAKQKDIIESLYKDEIANCIMQDAKLTKPTYLTTLIRNISQDLHIDIKLCEVLVDSIKVHIVRNLALQQKRVDGRKLDEIRHIDIESNILPFAHGSACFSRGQTQALVTCTIGGQGDIKIHDNIISQKKSNIMLHYNFPPFSVGEAMPLGVVSRRELGHGNLALKAIESNILESNKTIRLVSEILQSDGSSSMATICGSSLALMSANIKMQNIVAGIAMGVVCDDNRYAILSDIAEIEDACGDMDFKIAGTKRGFSALQLDIKIPCISIEILDHVLQKATFGLQHILSIMEKVEIVPNCDVLPKDIIFSVPNGSMADIIGHGGKVIREIIAKFDVLIDLDKENNMVIITGNNHNAIKNAKKYIFEILKKRDLPYKPNEKYLGVVKKIIDYGILVDLPQGGVGLLRNSHLESLKGCKIGDKIEVKVMSNINGRVELDLA